jgi:hypothetical protein
MPSFLNMKYRDNARQTSTVQFHVRPITAANLDAVATEFNTLRTTLEPFTLANLNSYEVVQNRVFVSNGAAASPVARRELKMLITYEDAVTHQTYDHEVPAPELTNAALCVNSGGRTFAVTDTAEWDALEAAFEATVVSPDGNAVILQSIEIVGRNL